MDASTATLRPNRVLISCSCNRGQTCLKSVVYSLTVIDFGACSTRRLVRPLIPIAYERSTWLTFSSDSDAPPCDGDSRVTRFHVI